MTEVTQADRDAATAYMSSSVAIWHCNDEEDLAKAFAAHCEAALAEGKRIGMERAAEIADAEMNKCNEYIARKLGGDLGVEKNLARYQTARSILAAIRAEAAKLEKTYD